MLAQAGLANGRVGTAGVAEQSFEYGARIPFHWKRLRRAAPGQRVRIDTTQVPGTCPRIGRDVHRHFQRRHLGFVGKVPGHHLVDRHVGNDLDFVPSTPGRTGQKRTGSARMDVVPVGLDTRENEHLVLERGQGRQDRSQLEIAAFGLRRPVLHGHPVRHIERQEPVGRPRCLGGQCRRNHRVQERQGDGRAHSAQHRSPGQRIIEDEHSNSSRPPPGLAFHRLLYFIPLLHSTAVRPSSAVLIRNGTLRTMPPTSDDQL